MLNVYHVARMFLTMLTSVMSLGPAVRLTSESYCLTLGKLLSAYELQLFALKSRHHDNTHLMESHRQK